MSNFQSMQDAARQMDAEDRLAGIRERFHIPREPNGTPVVYLAGNSLGLQPVAARGLVEEVLSGWAQRGVDGHFDGEHSWYGYHELFRESGARLVGAVPGEVVMMNTLTVNLHLMMVSFFRPTPERFKILIEEPCFPSDRYAVLSQLRCHGLDTKEALLAIGPRAGETVLRQEDIEEAIAREGERIALVLLSAVNFVTGQVLDVARITAAAHDRGCLVGFDLAHAAGNVPLRLHDWDVDFAVWCNYKYLNAGPGAVGGCFVHERHGRDLELPRFAGWWGNDPSTRFRMHLESEFTPRSGAEGWQVSNPPILSLAPLRASLDIFDEIGMDALRDKSRKLTGFLVDLLDPLSDGWFEIITPRSSEERGCQVSLAFRDGARDVLTSLHAEGIVCDFREPNILRAAPTPLYNRFDDVWQFAEALSRLRGASGR